MRLRFEPPAAEEIEEAAAYFDGRSVGAGERFLADIDAAKEMLLQFPNSGSPLRGDLRRVLLKVFPYQIVYRIQGDEVRVYAVAHLKRKPGYWRKRLPE